MKKWSYKRPLEGDNLVVYYYLGASEIWPDEKGCPWVGVTFKILFDNLIKMKI
jgi:hypothetical protein